MAVKPYKLQQQHEQRTKWCWCGTGDLLEWFVQRMDDIITAAILPWGLIRQQFRVRLFSFLPQIMACLITPREQIFKFYFINIYTAVNSALYTKNMNTKI